MRNPVILNGAPSWYIVQSDNEIFLRMYSDATAGPMNTIQWNADTDYRLVDIGFFRYVLDVLGTELTSEVNVFYPDMTGIPVAKGVDHVTTETCSGTSFKHHVLDLNFPTNSYVTLTQFSAAASFNADTWVRFRKKTELSKMEEKKPCGLIDYFRGEC